MFTNHIYLIYMHKKDLAFKNRQWFICHKTQPKQAIIKSKYKRNFKKLQWDVENINIYNYNLIFTNYSNSSTECFVGSQLISVTRPVRYLKLGSKPGQLTLAR